MTGVRGSVVVVGAGIIGAACARTLCARGFDVTLIERGAAVGGTSASGEGNLLLSDKLPGPELHLAQYSMGLWAEVTDELRSEVAAEFPSVEYELKGGLVVAFGDGSRRRCRSSPSDKVSTAFDSKCSVLTKRGVSSPI